ncbi:MAG: HslU--HslV peptidase ATPase subunit [Campylobacterales bacterium]
MTPQEIVAYLDEYIIGQQEAKKTIAVALRNRWRRMQLPKEMQAEITPKNILMIGPTGVGKTEIARRMARIMGLPFIKVEASKYTEVGFVGRDVESMVRDLVATAINLVRDEHQAKNSEAITAHVLDTIAKKLLPPLPKGASQEKEEEYARNFEKMKSRIAAGEVDHLKIEVEIPRKTPEINDATIPPEMQRLQESFMKLLGGSETLIKREVTVAEAKELLRAQAAEALLDMEAIKQEALKRAQNEGIIFIDEIDKIAVNQKNSGRNDPSKEGVQRDLLPIVEGSTVSTKYGPVQTDHILFIGAGAFHLSKPSDLIPELQGRFPLRVELSSLDEEALYQILTHTKNSLLRQYEALMSVEGIELAFEEEAVRELARYSQLANQKTEDIGARRLHTVIEKVMEEMSFNADRYRGKKIVITAEDVRNKLDTLIENVDMTRYIL